MALFRYSVMRQLADPELGPRRRGVMTRALAELELEHDRTPAELLATALVMKREAPRRTAA